MAAEDTKTKPLMDVIIDYSKDIGWAVSAAWLDFDTGVISRPMVTRPHGSTLETFGVTGTMHIKLLRLLEVEVTQRADAALKYGQDINLKFGGMPDFKADLYTVDSRGHGHCIAADLSFVVDCSKVFLHQS